ncbi:MAG: hypothetical protein LKJ86_07515 [Oscillibacter sp.]|nr:hypothetical protein [Oscillibacter sp.]
MQNQAYKRFTAGLLAVALLILTACAAFVWAVDPCFYYHGTENMGAVFFNERYQDAGIAKNTDADTVILGTSMVANYRVSHIENTFGGTAVKLTIPDGYLSEFDAVMNVEWRYHNPKRVIFGLDTNILIRDEREKTDAMPAYLYNANPLDDAKYLLNKDTLYYGVYRLMSNRWGTTQKVDDAYTWDGTVWWNHATALDNYDRPEISGKTLPADAYLENVSANLAIVERWLESHPDTEFDIFFPPYSILYWDKQVREGNVDAVFAALDTAFDTLLRYNNVNLFYFPSDEAIVTNLDNYCDYIHHSGAVCDKLLECMAAGEHQITRDNAKKMLADWKDFVVHYDYEPYWTDTFWWKWDYTDHPLT